ncbi:MAG: transcriptional regulator [Syntrophomonas sp.]|nr:transcriptional regulator [Syntrophomonas sp.]
MQFSEKLNFLMDITKTTNSALSRYVLLDASYISRLRRGKRQLLRNEETVKGMAAYFARKCGEEYQKKAVKDALRLNPFPKDILSLTKAITRWLLAENDNNRELIEQFLGNLSVRESSVTIETGYQWDKTTFPNRETAIYYGVEGKRQAAIYCLSEMISLNKPQTLLLFSDEETSWMTEDPVFSKHWAALMFQTIARGHRIKIIHTISRDLDEMLSAISQWMPLYMTGAIEPYYYPKKRDGVFGHTFFIAPGTAALVSSSVGGQTAHAANVLHRNAAAVAAYEEEFQQYLRLCQPLMLIFNAKESDAALFTLTEFERERCNTLIKTESLSLLTMPQTLFANILERTELERERFLEYHSLRTDNFRQTVNTNTFSEIIKLPEPQVVIEGQVKVALSDMLAGGAIYYTPQEYLLHIQNIVELLNKYENYHVNLVRGSVEDRYMVYVKEEMGAIVAKTSLPPVVLAMSESNMTASFWAFLKTEAGAKTFDKPDNRNTISKLSGYIDHLNKLITVPDL